MTDDASVFRWGQLTHSRRAIIASSLAAITLRATGSGSSQAAAAAPYAIPRTSRTWLLDASDELRPPAPGVPTSDERADVLRLQSERTATTAANIAKWAGEPAVLPWTNLALDLIRVHRPSPVRAGRALALLHAALHDTIIATWDAKLSHPRQAPWQEDSQVTLLGSLESTNSAFPSEHAAVAAAASSILIHLFPTEPPEGLVALAEEAAESRLWAGANYRSDLEGGFAIGREVGRRAIARSETDGANAAWDGSGRPAGDDAWQPTPPGFIQKPLDPLAGTWRTWVIPSGDVYRPPPPPAAGSPAWLAELAAVQDAVTRRTAEQAAAVQFWAGGPGTSTPAGLWIEVARELIVREGLDTPQAARVLALTSVAMADAFICCWDAKYTYWSARPITADPALDVLIPTPPFPSYTSGHASASTAAATILGHLFPVDEADLLDKAAEATKTRLWSGIHFPIDCDMGVVGGGLVGRLVVLRAQSDEEN